MTKPPKGVAQKHDRLPVIRPPDADPLQVYCPDLEQWARSWSYEPRDIPPGLQMVECFNPFMPHQLTMDLSRPTLRRHRDNLWVLGGEIIRQLQMDSDLRKQPIEQVVGDLINDEGGPLPLPRRARGRAARLRRDMPRSFRASWPLSRAAAAPRKTINFTTNPVNH